jgi:hypothetical protein
MGADNIAKGHMGIPVPDESVLEFVEDEVKRGGRLNGVSALCYLMRLQCPSAEQRAGLRLALAMYGDRVDPSARALMREAIATH